MDTLSIVSLCISLVFVIGAIYINIRLSKIYIEAKNKVSK